MAVLTVIFGVLMFLGGIACICMPATAAGGYMYFYMVMLFVTGVMLLIRCIATRRFGIDFFFAILTLIFGGIMVFNYRASFVAEIVMLRIAAIWLIVCGIVSLVNAIRTRRLVGGGWFALGLILSILEILLGCYSFVHLQFFMELIGVLIGAYFMLLGIDMVVLGCTSRRLR